MYKYIFIILLILFFIYYLNFNTIESFNNDEEDKDDYDREFVNFYEIIYRDYSDVDMEWDIIKKKAFTGFKKDDPSILLIGCGVGKLASRIKNNYSNLLAIDKSQNMVNKAYELYPNIKFLKCDIIRIYWP